MATVLVGSNAPSSQDKTDLQAAFDLVSTDALTTALAAKANLASPALTGTPTAPTAAGATSTTQVATMAAVQAAIDLKVSGALSFVGEIDASANPEFPAGTKGEAYIVSVAGKVGGASGNTVTIGDWVICTADNAGGTEAAVGASWAEIEQNLVGALLAANNLSDLASASTAWTNLGGPAKVLDQVLTGIDVATTGDVTAADTIKEAIGKLQATKGTGAGATNLAYTASASNGIVTSDTGTDATLTLSDGTNAGLLSPAQHNKLAAIAAGATANATDAQLRDRSTHTGTQAASTISDSTTAGRALLTAVDVSAQRTALGLGNSATRAVGTAAGTVAAGDDARIAGAPRTYSATVGGAVSSVVTHNLNTRDVMVTFRDVATNQPVGVAWSASSVNAVTLTWPVAPSAASIRVTVIGLEGSA